jgi:hypothetical protein
MDERVPLGGEYGFNAPQDVFQRRILDVDVRSVRDLSQRMGIDALSRISATARKAQVENYAPKIGFLLRLSRPMSGKAPPFRATHPIR